MKSSKYVEYIIKKYNNNLSAEDKRRFNEWLLKDSQNNQHVESIVKILEQGKKLPRIPTPDIEQEWRLLAPRLKTRSETASRNRVFRFGGMLHYFSGKRIAYAIGLILLCMVCCWKLLIGFNYKTYITGNGQISEIITPDNSHIILNSGSQLRYKKFFSKQQRIFYLHGEAYFQVEKDKRPFIVFTGNAKTTVLGTTFNVWTRNNKTKVIVKEGVVQFSSLSSNLNDVTLLKDQMSEVVKGNKPTGAKEVDAGYLLGWLNKKLVFDKTPLYEAIEEIERFYDVTINLDKELANKSLSAQFSFDSVQSVLKKICLAFDAELKYEADKYWILSTP